MKRVFSLIILSALTSTLSFGQESQKVREAGITFRNLDSFGFTYRFGNTNSVWRLSGMSASGSMSQYDFTDSLNAPSNSSNFGIAVGFGREKRINIVDNLDLRLGGLIHGRYRFRYSMQELTTTMPDGSTVSSELERTTNEYTVGASFILGFNYNIKNKLIVGIEVLPGVSYTMSENDREVQLSDNVTQNVNTFGYDVGLSTTTLSLVYRFMR